MRCLPVKAQRHLHQGSVFSSGPSNATERCLVQLVFIVRLEDDLAFASESKRCLQCAQIEESGEDC